MYIERATVPIEHLPNKLEVLSSIHSIANKKKQTKEQLLLTSESEFALTFLSSLEISNF
jgi:hypothetical protein